jgi:hypothetical protein
VARPGHARQAPRRLAGLACLAVTVAACGTSPIAPSPSPRQSSPAAVADGSAAEADSAIPRILIRSPDGTFSIEDPHRPAGPGNRRRLLIPAGHWSVTTGPATMAISSLDNDTAGSILLGTVPDATFVVDKQIALPANDAWRGGYAACVSGAGPILAADVGLRMWLVAPGEDPVILPDQRDNTGRCAWLDDSRVVWEQENDRLATFNLETAKTTQLPAVDIIGDPSGGQSRIAGRTATNGISVNVYAADGPSLEIGATIGTIDPEVGGVLSPDGHWLVTAGPDRVARLYRVDDAGLVPVGSFAINANEQVDWMPQPVPPPEP